MTKSRWRIEWEQGLMTLDERATDPAADDMTKAVPKPPKGIGHPAHAAPPHAAPVLPNTGGNDIALALFGLGLVGVGTTLLNRNRNRKGNR